jgi:site-specific DNA recombinase
MSTAAIYARVSSARQKEDQTIASQTAALRAAAERSGLQVPPEWIFEDEGYSGATLIRLALERLRDLAAQVPIDVVLCYSPDRLARRYAYQALLIDEFARVGTEVRFVNGPKGETPEDKLLIQFQGMIAEYERAQIAERTRRGKAHRARTGTVNVLSGAPYGYRYLRRSETADARYEIIEEEALVVREMFRRYAEDQSSIAELTRWLRAEGISTRTGKERWDRSTVWGMLRNPAYAGRAGYLKTMRFEQRAHVNRTARRQGQSVSRHAMSRPRAEEEWIIIAVPAAVSEETFALAARRLQDNRRFASRNAKEPSLLMGLVACQSCGYAYYRTSTRTKNASCTTTAALVLMTTAISTDVSARTSRCGPTTSTISSGARSLPCWPIPLWCRPNWTDASKSCGRPIRPPPNGPGLSSTSPGPPRASNDSSMPTKKTCSPSTSCAPGCPSCARRRRA